MELLKRIISVDFFLNTVLLQVRKLAGSVATFALLLCVFPQHCTAFHFIAINLSFFHLTECWIAVQILCNHLPFAIATIEN